MNPEFGDEEPLNPFDMWEGANFKLKIRNVEGYRNYDKSEFDSKGPLADDDEEMEKIWAKEYSLAEFLDPKLFKSYEDLQARLHKVLGLDGSVPQQKIEDEETPVLKQKSKPATRAPAIEEDDDEGTEFFRKLAEEEA
jgi:hypothetical protein